VLSDIVQAVNAGDFTVLALLDPSTDFDTVDHEYCYNIYSHHMISMVLHFYGFNRIYTVEYRLYVKDLSSHPLQLYHMALLKKLFWEQSCSLCTCTSVTVSVRIL